MCVAWEVKGGHEHEAVQVRTWTQVPRLPGRVLPRRPSGPRDREALEGVLEPTSHSRLVLPGPRRVEAFWLLRSYRYRLV